VHIERQWGELAESRHERHAIGEVGDEHSIHHVEMQTGRPGNGESIDLASEVSKIAEEHRRQYGRRGVR
jgi:hypothetical protein